MMREIKFRGKRVDTGEWVYGFYSKTIPETSETYIMPEWMYNCYESMGKNEQWSLKFDKYFEVIPETVCQYTGLKDKNGAEIYEGDWVRSDRFGVGGTIQYDPERMAFVFQTDGVCRCKKAVHGYVLGRNAATNLEVIGNIHDKEAYHG